MTNIWIRTDASRTIGSGHVMRMLTLAEQLRKHGASVCFISREHPGHMIDTIEAHGFPVYSLPFTYHSGERNLIRNYDTWLGAYLEEEIAQVKAIFDVQLKGERADWLIVDHYALDRTWERALRHYARRIMVVDDLADRPHDCDLLLDQNAHEHLEERYNTLVPPNTKKLLGPAYALLRDEFRTVLNKDRLQVKEISRILIFFGGSDPTNETEKALTALKDHRYSHIVMDVIVGKSNPQKERIQKICQTFHQANYLLQIDNMAERMAQADLFIGAGGSATWERCYLGLPSIVIAVAENQVEAMEYLAKQGAVLYLGWHQHITPDSIRQSVNELIQNPEKLIEMSRICQAIMSGKKNNWDRVARLLLNPDIT